MPRLSSETLAEIRAMVRGGFYDDDRIVEIFAEERYEPGELDKNELALAVRNEFKALRIEQANWPRPTDCDRLDNAFAAMRRRGVVALQNAGYTQGDGYSDCMEAYENASDKPSIVGYCFYHEQDLERAISDGHLYLAFGPVDPVQEKSHGHAVGKMITEELKRAGLSVQWDGSFASRISIPKILWQRRLP